MVMQIKLIVVVVVSKQQHIVQADLSTWLIREILFEFGKC